MLQFSNISVHWESWKDHVKSAIFWAPTLENMTQEVWGKTQVTVMQESLQKHQLKSYAWPWCQEHLNSKLSLIADLGPPILSSFDLLLFSYKKDTMLYNSVECEH